jgi:DNA-binding CsgD family transcriptional regulator
MSDKPSNHIVIGRLVQAFIRAGWSPPPPPTRVMHRMLDDMAEGRDPAGHDNAIPKATLDLSPQQRTVLSLAAMGMTSRDAAQALGVSLETVRWTIKKARARLGARTTTQAVALALREQVISLRDGSPARELAASCPPPNGSRKAPAQVEELLLIP